MVLARCACRYSVKERVMADKYRVAGVMEDLCGKYPYLKKDVVVRMACAQLLYEGLSELRESLHADFNGLRWPEHLG